MKAFILPFGKPGWRKKTEILNKLISSRPGPPSLYNDVLILVPSSRMKRTYGRFFLERAAEKGSPALVPPEIKTLHQFLQEQFSRLHGPRLIDENSRLVLLEGIVKERLKNTSFSLDPALLAPSLSSALAKMIEQLSNVDAGPEKVASKIQGSEFSDKPQVRLLIDVFTQYRNMLHDYKLTDPAGMRMLLRDRFNPEWLKQYRVIIIDGIPYGEKLETEILRKIAACTDCTWLVEAPSPDLLKKAGEVHPLRILRDFISAVGVDPAGEETDTDPDNLSVASSLFSEMPFAGLIEKAPASSSFLKKIDVVSAINIREEVSFIAGEVKKSLRSGTGADSILVTFPALDEYAPLVEEIFSDYGIPYNRALGRRLSGSPVIAAVISLLRSCQEDFSSPSLLRIFTSPFLKYGDRPAIASALDRLIRRAKITGGKQKFLLALQRQMRSESGGDILTEPLEELFTALEPFTDRDSASLSSWMDSLSILIKWSGLAARVALMKGALNVNLQAYKKLSETLVSLVRAGNLFPDYRYTFDEWLFLLKKTLMHTRFQVPPEDEGGVQILGFEETLGRPWSEVYLGGLVDGKFPQRGTPNIFLPEQILADLGVHTLDRTRLHAAYHFYRLLLSAGRITLTHPENHGDRPAIPSPFLEELTPLKKAGLINREREKTSGLQFSLRIEDSRSIPELAKAVSAGVSRSVLLKPDSINALAEIMPEHSSEINAIKAAVEQRETGLIPLVRPLAKRVFQVTELDAYLNCPYDYYVTTVLGLEPLEEVTEDISPMGRGSTVHSILRNFYLSWGRERAISRENNEEARALLTKLADAAFGNEADTFRNRREKEFFLAVMAERFLEAEEAFWKQGMKPAYLEHRIEHYPLILSNNEEVELSAKIDRIDVDKNGDFIIVDYKTGNYPSARMNLDQDIFQLPVYAAMAQKILSAGPATEFPPLRKPIGLAYYDLSGRIGAGARDVVLFDKETRDDHPSSKPIASPKSRRDFETILDQSMEKARRAVEGILGGRFPGKPREENKCRFCANMMMCGGEKDENPDTSIP